MDLTSDFLVNPAVLEPLLTRFSGSEPQQIMQVAGDPVALTAYLTESNDLTLSEETGMLATLPIDAQSALSESTLRAA